MKNAKRNWIATLSLVATMAAGLGVGASYQAQADVTIDSAKDIAVTMVDGAGVRCVGTDAKDNGIRFQMSASVAEIDALESYASANGGSVKYGMVFAPRTWADVADFTEANLFGGSAVYTWDNKNAAYGAGSATILHANAGKEVDEKDETKYVFSGSVVKMLESNLTREYVAKGYIAYFNSDSELVDVQVANYYEGSIDNNTRSIVYVAQKAVEANNPQSAWLLENYINHEVVQALDQTYYVDHYVEKADGSYEVIKTEEKTAKIGATVTADAIDLGEYCVAKSDVVSGTVYANGKTRLAKYYDVDESKFVAPTISVARDDKLMMNVTGENLLVTVNGTQVASEGTTYSAEVTANSVISAKSVYTVNGETFESATTDKYVSTSFLTADSAFAGATIIEDFSGADMWANNPNIGDLKNVPVGYDGNVAVNGALSYQASFKDGYNLTSSGVLKLDNSSTGANINNTTQFGGFTYTFPASLDTSSMAKIGIQAQWSGWEIARFAASYYGIVSNGVHYSLTKDYMSYQGRGNDWGEVTAFTSDYFTGNVLCAMYWIDVQKFVADNPTITSIDGIYIGSRNQITYFDKIVYTEVQVTEPTISFTRTDGKLSVSVATEDSLGLEVTINGTAQEVTGNTFTAELSTDSVVTARSKYGAKYSETVEKYVDGNYLATDSVTGGKVLADFNSEVAVKQAGIVAANGGWGSVSSSTIAHAATYSNDLIESDGALKATTTSTWSGWTYYFTETLSVANVSKIGVRVAMNATSDSHYNDPYWGIIVNGTCYKMSSGIWSYQNYKSDGTLGEVQTAWVNGGFNSAATVFYFDVQAFLTANNLTAGDIEGVYMGISKTKDIYVDTIVYI